MTDLEILARILLAIAFGAILGLETETREGDNTEAAKRLKLGGVRTYTVLTLFGAVGGVIFYAGQPVFGYMMFAAVFLIVLSAYILNVRYKHAFGITTEVAILIAALVGFMATSGIISLQILIVVIVILTFILSQKKGVGLLVNKIAHRELIDIVKFTIVALVIFPFLPNQDFRLGEISFLSGLWEGDQMHQLANVVFLNPFKLWQYVVVISGFSLLGYLGSKLVGKSKGFLLSGVLGGMVSSTSTIFTLSEAGREESEPAQAELAGISLVSNAVSFVPMGILALSTSAAFFLAGAGVALVMCVVSLLAGVVIMYLQSRQNKPRHELQVKYKPFSLNLALKFVLLLTVFRLLVQIANIQIGNGGFVFFTVISGAVGMDVATITLGEMTSAGLATPGLAVMMFVAANAVNFSAKSLYASWQGGRTYAKLLTAGLLLTAIMGVVIQGGG